METDEHGCQTIQEFRNDALDVLPSLGVEPSRFNTAVDSLVAHFGKDWLHKQMVKLDQGSALAHRSHPIGTMLSCPSMSHVVDLLEVASYIELFDNDPEFSSALAQLRNSDDYLHALLQLHVGSRFRRVGCRVQLEPRTANGRSADLEIEVDGRTYLIECYVLRHEVSGDEHYQMEKLCVSLCSDKFAPITVVSVHFFVPINATNRKTVVAEASRLAAEIKIGEHREARNSEYHLLLQRFESESEHKLVPFPQRSSELPSEAFIERYGPPSARMITSSVPSERLVELRLEHRVSGLGRNEARVWRPGHDLPPSWVDKTIGRLFETLDRKVSQAKRNGKEHRVMVAECSGISPRDLSARSQLARMVQTLARKHHGLIGVAIATKQSPAYASRHPGYGISFQSAMNPMPHAGFLNVLLS